MLSRKRGEAPPPASSQPAGQDNEISAAWKGLNQTKAALRHIENRLEAAPGTGVLLESVMDTTKASGSRKVSRRDGRRSEDPTHAGAGSKSRVRSRRSPDKSSRSPLRNTTLDTNVRKASCVEFKEPLASYREASPPPLIPSPLEGRRVLPEAPASLPADAALSQLVYQRDTRDQQTLDLDATRSSTLDSTVVRYLNDRPALNQAAARAGDRNGEGSEGRPRARAPQQTPLRAETSQSSSPGSASQRLENLRRRQPDDKLEKLKERIRRQREHLEEAAERDRLLGYLEQPVGIGGAAESSTAAPTAKVRKVAPAPPAPIYKGFNTSETKIRTPDGKVWREEEFNNLSREIYRDLTRQLSESTKPKPAEKVKERKPPKPVRKVHRSASVPDPETKPAVGAAAWRDGPALTPAAISTAAWREGQKLVKMVLGPAPRRPRQPRAESTDGAVGTGPMSRSSSDPRPELNRRSRPSSAERPRERVRSENQSRGAQPAPESAGPPAGEVSGKASSTPNTDLLSADIRGILDDLQLESRAAGPVQEEGRRAAGPSARAHTSARGSRSASPAKSAPEVPEPAGPKKRHYDADAVRQYIARQQEERKRRQADERRTQREETERKTQRLQELYRRQRGGAARGQPASEGPAQKRLQETYTKLLLEQAQLAEEPSHAPLPLPTASQQRPLYQPSGESDKENKRQDRPLSASSSSDLSLSEQPPPALCRTELAGPSWLQLDRPSPAVRGSAGPLAPPSAQLFSQLLGLDSGPAAAAAAWGGVPARAQPAESSRSKLSRIEALKATAASLSSRIESEARKLAGPGINYGCVRDMDPVAGGAVQPRGDSCWAKPLSPPVREIADADELALKIQRLLSAGQSTYSGLLPGASTYNGLLPGPSTYSGLLPGASTYSGLLPGAGSLHSVRDLRDRGSDPGRPQSASATSALARRNQPEESPEPPAEGREGLLDSSGGSISEGPLLSEGSMSEGDGSPRHSLQELPKPAQRLGALDFCPAQQEALNHISRFQREAEKYPAYTGTPPARDGRGPWEELAKGSPHSVINIFTKNLSSYGKVMEDRVERSSPALRPGQSAASSVDGVTYEDDFISSRSGGSSQSAKRTPNGRSRGHSVTSPQDEVLSRRSAYDTRNADLLSRHSSGSTPASSPRSASSICKKGSERGVEHVQVEGQRSLSSHGSPELLSLGSRRSGPDRGSAPSSGRGADTDRTLGGASALSIHSLGSDGKKSPRSPGLSPAGSPAGSGSPRVSPGNGPSAAASGLGSSSSHTPALPGSSSSAGRSKSTTAPSAHSARAEPTAAPSAHSARAEPTAAPSSHSAWAEPTAAPSAHSARAEPTAAPSSHSARAELKTTGELHYAPVVLEQRLSAELSYLAAMEESVRQLGDVERVRGVALAQQESVSLAQILKSQQQRHERDLYKLKVKAEQEALETKRQLEETRQRAARAHAELQENMAQSQQATLGGLQDATSKMISQQAEAARYTADAARHIKEMTEMARSQIAGALSVPAPPITALYDQQRQQHHSFMKQLQSRNDTDSSKSEVSPARTRTDEAASPLDSLSESIPSRRPTISGGGSSSAQLSGSLASLEQQERGGPGGRKAAGSSSVEEEEAARTAADDSIPSLVDDKDSVSVATEYSLKFDESMTEDEIEERSFRSLLPSESHRRGTLEKKPSPLGESDDEASQEKSSPQDLSKQQQDGSMPFSSGQNSFSKFTMDMVRQYMKEEEVRAHHQSSLLRLRQKALKEKTKAELAWLEHQKRRLRDKGEDDKMPPIRKKQRGLLLKLQQEQAEIKRLQEANKAARKERQLLLKQQEEIERMRHTTLKFKERLKCAGDSTPETPTSEPVEEAAPPSVIVTDADTRSPSPISVSGSETSSIMQKLKKMRCHMDENISDADVVIGTYRGFLTKREQQLMQRRRHAEELLEWKLRLDAEEVEVRRMEKQAMAAWDQQDANAGSSSSTRHDGPGSPVGQSDREAGSEEDYSSAHTVSSVHTELSVPEQLSSPSAEVPASELPSAHDASSPQADSLYSQQFESPSESKLSPSAKASLSTTRHPESSRASSKMQLRSASGSRSDDPQASEPPSVAQSEPTSDQSDIESRVRALKEELRKRKSVVCQLKKEQRKRQKERLKAQEASLLKQLESYNDFIQKTTAELNKEPDGTPMTKPQIKTPTSATEKPRIKPPPLQRPETSKNWKIVTESEKAEKVLPDSPVENDVTPSGRSKYSSVHEEDSSDEDPPTVTPTPVLGSPEHTLNGLKSLLSPEPLPGLLSDDALALDWPPRPRATDSGDESLVSSHRSEVMEELDYLKSEGSENGHSHSPSERHAEPSLKLDLQPASQQGKPSLKDWDSTKMGEEGLSRMSSKDLEEEQKPEDSVDAGEDMKSRSSISNKSPMVEPKGPDHQLPEKSSSVRDRSYTPDSDVSKREDVTKHKEASSPSVEGYNDDFESSVESSFREASKPTSHSAPESRERSCNGSPFYSSEEEIDEDLSVKSGATSGSFHSERLLELKSQVMDSRDEDKDEVISSKMSPTSPHSQSPSSPAPDEMPSFRVGDRVLVSNVQAGTLRFKGPTSFANGFWAGVELDKSEGSNNGTYDGVAYFECKEDHGIFAPPDKISRLPEKFEIYVDTTDDEDPFFDDQSNKEPEKHNSEEQSQRRNLLNKKEEKSDQAYCSEEKGPTDTSDGPAEHQTNLPLSGKDHFMRSRVSSEFNDIDFSFSEDFKVDKHPVPNGRSRDIILEFEDAPSADGNLLVSDLDKGTSKRQILDESKTSAIMDLLVSGKSEAHHKPSDLSIEEPGVERLDGQDVNECGTLGAFADKLVNNFVRDAVKQFQQIKKAKDEKISAANRRKGDFVNEDDWLGGESVSRPVNSFNGKTDGHSAFFDEEQEEASSPELCNRPESPVLGASGQEELAKRLAELELSRELLDVLGDEQDWFDEDFGLSSRKEQEQQKRQQQQQQQEGLSGSLGLTSGDQAKTPPRPELPKAPEEPAMVVPHTAPEVEKLVHAATREIWRSCGLGQGKQSLAAVPKPQASDDFLGGDAQEQDQETRCKRSYRQAVFDLSWEVIQEIFGEDPNADQPQWVKPRHMNSSNFHRVKCPSDITKVQVFVTTEVLKLYRLKKDNNQKTDWQKMLKFGRKKRDRVDHILVQELHEEESQWVNYDEDELYVKMQLADGIFDALLKDTADVLTQIQEKRSKRALS